MLRRFVVLVVLLLGTAAIAQEKAAPKVPAGVRYEQDIEFGGEQFAVPVPKMLLQLGLVRKNAIQTAIASKSQQRVIAAPASSDTD